MRKFLSVLFLGVTSFGFGQILDDSTELVYGPHTTRFVYEEDIINNEADLDQYTPLDTLLTLFDRQSLVDRSARRYQNLGNFGTATTSVFFDPQELIGRTSGFNAFTPYARRGRRSIKFYDTKSPYINLLTYIGGGNKNIVNIDYSRNVREGWNLGFDLHKITTDKLYARNNVGDRQTISTAFDVYTHYKHKKAPYQAVIYYSRLSHNVVEQGGTRFGQDSIQSELFQLNNALLRLENAQNLRSESELHVYQDYQIADQFQLYHSIDFYKEENVYQDYQDGFFSDTEYDTYRDAYNGVFQLDADSTQERARFSSITNEAGIKGDLSNIFYRAYAKLRTLDFDYFLLDPTSRVTETYIGGYARFDWKERFKVIGAAEIMQTGEYSFSGSLKSDLVNVKYESKRYSVPYIYTDYFGNHYEWNNSFNPVFVNRLDGSVNLNLKSYTIRPKATLTTYTDYVYFDENQLPVQAPSGIAIATLGADLNAVFKNAKGEGFYVENEILATSVSGGSSDAIRIPELFYNGRYYWSGLLFGDKVPIQVGFDTHARSGYFANQYNPVTQQFYVQNEFEIEDYFKADLFFTMRLDKFYVGLKWAHFDRPADSGYFMTPYYPGQPTNFDIMIRWSFFD